LSKAYESPLLAVPNKGHRCLAALARHGHVWRFIQQNHDGLPQKAGMPQRLINEVRFNHCENKFVC
jgi:NAD-dependent SIR2 family protein deacetylase